MPNVVLLFNWESTLFVPLTPRLDDFDVIFECIFVAVINGTYLLRM